MQKDGAGRGGQRQLKVWKLDALLEKHGRVCSKLWRARTTKYDLARGRLRLRRTGFARLPQSRDNVGGQRALSCLKRRVIL